MSPAQRPPRVSSLVLRLIPDAERRELIEGDLAERYRDRLARGRLRARLWHVGQALRCVAVDRAASLRDGGAVASLASDVRDALRGIRAKPALAALVVLTLALGFGATSAMLGIADAVLVRPLPYPEPDRIVWIHAAPPAGGSDPYGQLTHREIERLREAELGFSAVGGYSVAGRTVTGEGMEPLELDFARVTRGFQEALGMRVVLGRAFSDAELAAGEAVVLLSHEMWTQRMQGDPAALGRRLEIRGVPHTVIGVAGPDATFPAGAAFWRPLTQEERSDDDRELRAFGRLRDGARTEHVSARLAALSTSLPTSVDDRRTLWSEPIRSSLVRRARAPLLILTSGAWLVLLIACANVANLLLARGEERRRALALRAALGATRARLVRMQFLESGLLATLGGVAGAVVGTLTLPALVALAPEDTPRIQEATVDGRVLAAMVAFVTLAAFLAGVVPALRRVRIRPFETMAARGGGGRVRDRRTPLRALLGGQIALSTLLVTAAGLLLVSLHGLTRDPGFDPDGVLTVDLYPSETAVAAHGGPPGYRRAVREALSGLPGVTAVGLGSQPPTAARGFNAGLLDLAVATGDPAAAGLGGGSLDGAGVVEAGPSYFSTLGIALLHGRAFRASDAADAPLVAIVNRETARRFLGAEGGSGPGAANAVGRGLTGLHPRTGAKTEIEVVGVVEDVRPDPRVPPVPLVYVPTAQVGIAGTAAHIRVAGDPASVVPGLRSALRAIDGDLPLNRISALEDEMIALHGSPAFVSRVLLGFGGLALALALLGSYGVAAYGMNRRLPELGVRRALGASPGRLGRLVLREGAGTVLVGVAGGMVGAWVASRLLRSMLYEVAPVEPVIYGAVSLGVGAAALLAFWLPVRRASRSDPMLVLRQE